MGVRTHKRSENKTKPSGDLEWDTMTPDRVSGEKQYIREEPGSEGTREIFAFANACKKSGFWIRKRHFNFIWIEPIIFFFETSVAHLNLLAFSFFAESQHGCGYSWNLSESG